MRILITGARKGIGRYLAEYYLEKGHHVIGCSRGESDLEHALYRHFIADVADESQVKAMTKVLKKEKITIDVLINNAGIASMNHFLLTPTETAERVFKTNYLGTFIMCREVARLMRRSQSPRIVNFCTVAVPLDLAGEAAYASSKSAVATLTRVLSKELADMNIRVNAIGPTPIKTDLISGVPENKLEELLDSQAIKRYGKKEDVSNVIDFFIKPESDFITGQIIYLGGVF